MLEVEELLSEFRHAAELVLSKHISRYKGLTQKNPGNFYVDFSKIWKGFHEDLAQASADIFHKAATKATDVDKEFVAGVLRLNADCTTWFSNAVKPHV
ncbi:MAG: hypothetical protein ICV52_14695 [Microcoleus sp. C1-bin4]|nr:hypothetical protein [Microcoleus sp. C1-bin4]